MLYTVFTLLIFGWMVLLVLQYGMAAVPVMISLAAIAGSVWLIHHHHASFTRAKVPVRFSTKFR